MTTMTSPMLASIESVQPKCSYQRSAMPTMTAQSGLSQRAREMIATQEVLGKVKDILDVLPLLPDDYRFICECLVCVPDERHSEVLQNYRQVWQEAAVAAENDPIRRDNDARREANLWLLRFVKTNGNSFD